MGLHGLISKNFQVIDSKRLIINYKTNKVEINSIHYNDYNGLLWTMIDFYEKESKCFKTLKVNLRN